MKRSHYIIGGPRIGNLNAILPSKPQTEGYNNDPHDIMDASKVNVLPKVEEPTVSKKEVEYATTFFSGHFRSGRPDAPYTGKRSSTRHYPGICTCRIW